MDLCLGEQLISKDVWSIKEPIKLKPVPKTHQFAKIALIQDILRQADRGRRWR